MSALNLTLQVWRQTGPSSPGRLVRYEAHDISPDMSFLEMLDVVNERLQERGEAPIAFDHDCREGICGSCSLMINGVAHGPNPGTATCQLHMRSFRDGDEIRIEPWRARAFPVVRDLVVDRSALDRIIAAGGYISAATGGRPGREHHPDPQGHAWIPPWTPRSASAAAPAWRPVPTPRRRSSRPPRSPTWGSCPQGQPERIMRARQMVRQMDLEGFGGCTLYGECQEACPKEISIDTITRMNRDFLRAGLSSGRAAVAESD